MKITREHLKNIVKETMIEESEYQEFFKKALEKAGKSIPAMSDEEKKAFFNKIEKTWNDRGNKNEGNAFGAAVGKAKKDGDDSFEVDGKEYKTERFGRGHEGPTFGSEDESLNEIKYDTALADFNKELEKNSEVKKAAKHYNKSVKDVVKVLQSRIKVNRYSDKSIKRVSIDFKEDGPLSSKVSIKLSKDYKQNESVNESIEPQIKKIAYYTGTRPEAVEDFVSKHVLNITKLLKYVEKGGLPQRMELVSALAGRPNNPKQKKIIKQFQESVNEANSRDEYDAKEFWGVSKMGIQLHKQFKGRFNKSKFEKALSDLIGKSKRPESTIKIIGRYLNIKPSKLNSYTSGEIIEDQEFIKDSTKKAEQLYKIFVSSNESVVNEGISVFDERHFGKKGIIIMIDDNGKKVSAIFKDKKNADKYNRNNPSDIRALLKIAKTKPFGKAIDESVINEGPSTEEKRIAMLAVRKQAKYRNVSLEQAIQDQINALEDLKRDVKKGKLK